MQKYWMINLIIAQQKVSVQVSFKFSGFNRCVDLHQLPDFWKLFRDFLTKASYFMAAPLAKSSAKKKFLALIATEAASFVGWHRFKTESFAWRKYSFSEFLSFLHDEDRPINNLAGAFLHPLYLCCWWHCYKTYFNPLCMRSKMNWPLKI